MSALGDVPCGLCRACCQHDMIPLVPERGDLIWTYDHEVIATTAGTAAILQCAKNGECTYLVGTAALFTTGPRRSAERSIAGIYSTNCMVRPFTPRISLIGSVSV
jgi:hypothetical protein